MPCTLRALRAVRTHERACRRPRLRLLRATPPAATAVPAVRAAPGGGRDQEHRAGGAGAARVHQVPAAPGAASTRRRRWARLLPPLAQVGGPRGLPVAQLHAGCKPHPRPSTPLHTRSPRGGQHSCLGPASLVFASSNPLPPLSASLSKPLLLSSTHSKAPRPLLHPTQRAALGGFTTAPPALRSWGTTSWTWCAGR